MCKTKERNIMKTIERRILNDMIEAEEASGRIFHICFRKKDGAIRRMSVKHTNRYKRLPTVDSNRTPSVRDPKKVYPIEVTDNDILQEIGKIKKIVPETDECVFGEYLNPRRSFKPDLIIAAHMHGEILVAVDEEGNWMNQL